MWDGEMTDSELECLKSHIDRHVEIDTKNGERLLIKVISVFDQEFDPDVFFDVVPTENDPTPEGKAVGGYSLPLADILSVRPVPPE
jgi:hypothetical protein